MDLSGHCVGKMAYGTKAKALARINHHMGRRQRLKRASGWDAHCKLTAYRCQLCGEWHVGAGKEIQKRIAVQRVVHLSRASLDE